MCEYMRSDSVVKSVSKNSKHISDDLRKTVIAEMNAGASGSEVANRYGLKPNTVCVIYKKYVRSGVTTVRHGGGRQDKLSAEQKKVLYGWVDSDCGLSVKDLRQKCLEKWPQFKTISFCTITRALKGFRNSPEAPEGADVLNERLRSGEKSMKLEINDLFCELKTENNRLLYELRFAEKKCKILENYRNLLTNCVNNCQNCGQNTKIVNQLKIFEKDLKCFDTNLRTNAKNVVLNERKTYRRNDENIDNKSNDGKSGSHLKTTEDTNRVPVIDYNVDLDSNDGNSDCDLKTTEDYNEVENVATNQSNVSTDRKTTDVMSKRRRHVVMSTNGLKKCDFCDYSNKRLCLVVGHMNRHHLNASLPSMACDLCDKHFFSRVLLDYHMKREHNRSPAVPESRYYRREWSQTDERYDYIRIDLKTGEDIADEEEDSEEKAFYRKRWSTAWKRQYYLRLKPLKCDFCDYKYVNKSLFRDHVNRRHLKVVSHKCDSCGKGFSSNMSLERHVQTIHSAPEDLPLYPCDWKGCHFKAKRVLSLKNHRRRVHLGDTPFECTHPYCGRQFISQAELRGHSLTHCDQRPYGCEWPGCEARFKDDYRRKSHQKLHSCQHSLTCYWPGCEQSFRMKTHMTQHIQRVHKNVRNYVCNWPECDKRFSTTRRLRDHMNIHKGLKPFVCPREGCGVRFADQPNMYKHIRTAH